MPYLELRGRRDKRGRYQVSRLSAWNTLYSLWNCAIFRSTKGGEIQGTDIMKCHCYHSSRYISLEPLSKYSVEWILGDKKEDRVMKGVDIMNCITVISLEHLEIFCRTVQCGGLRGTDIKKPLMLSLATVYQLVVFLSYCASFEVRSWI